jgi:predicted DNA-binding protein with PD1-like motif
LTTRLITVSKGEEVMSTLQAAVTAAGIEHATISLIGAVDSATISVMKADDASVDYEREYRQPLELTGTGEVTDGKLHLHVTLFGEGGTVGGHLHRADVEAHFVRAYVTPVDA